MGRCCGRAWAYAAGFFLSFVALRPALAQDSDEVIVDPEPKPLGNDTGLFSN